MGTLARIEVSYHAHNSYFVAVNQWPIRIGRSLDNDVVLDDPHVAAYHLSLVGSTSEGLSVQVLETVNGICVNGCYHERQAHVELPYQRGCVEIVLGRTTLRIRTLFNALEPELHLHTLHHIHPVKVGGLLLALAVGMHLGEQYLDTTESSNFWRKLPETLLGTPLLYMGWAGVWALLCRLFAQPLHFWRHVALACGVYLAANGIDFLLRFIGFSFSWGVLEAWNRIPIWMLFSWLIFKHLSLVAPARQRILMFMCSAFYLVGVGVSLQQQYAKTYRLTDKLYASTLFPASLQSVKPVSLDVFSKELKSELLSKLEADLQRKSIDAGGDDF